MLSFLVSKALLGSYSAKRGIFGWDKIFWSNLAIPDYSGIARDKLFHPFGEIVLSQCLVPTFINIINYKLN